MAASLGVGSLAPDFDLPCTPRPGAGAQRARLADFRGRWLVLVFYPRDFSLVCPTELTALSARIEDFRKRGCEIIGVSSDSVETHERWIASPRSQGGLGGLAFALAADESGKTCRDYGVYLEWQHVALRGLFIVDPNGVLQYQVVHNLSVGRSSEEVLRVLSALQTGGLCSEDWSQGRPAIDVAESLRPGSVLGKYRIEKEVGAGAFARVYCARDEQLERIVALKVLKSAAGNAPHLGLAEARAAAALNHPNVCTIYAVEHAQGAALIAMEYLAGQSLARRLEGGRLSDGRVADLARQLAAGMAAAHAKGVIHGDLKPANVFVSDDGPLKILDFGLAQRQQSTRDLDATLDLLDHRGSISGTPAYLAPEQTQGQGATPATDVFAWGAILYEMLTGRQAFAGENVLQVLARIRAVDAAALAAELPHAFQSVARRALQRHPAERRVTMAELAATL